jgi:hypothetical protein
VTVTGGVAGVTLTWNPGSTVKLEQVIGDKDWAAAAKGTTLPTASLTSSRYGVFGTDIGTSFEHNGRVLFPLRRHAGRRSKGQSRRGGPDRLQHDDRR